MAYHVCESCAVAILNGDNSHLADDQQRVRLDDFLNDHGMLADAGMVPQNGYWDCEACGEVQIHGSAQAVEQA